IASVFGRRAFGGWQDQIDRGFGRGIELDAGADEFLTARSADRDPQVGGALFGISELSGGVFDLILSQFVGRDFAELLLAAQIPVERAHGHSRSELTV